MASGVEENAALLGSIGERVRGRRKARGLRLSDLSKLAGLSGRYLSEVENGRGNISISKLSAIADALEVPVSALLPEQERRGLRRSVDALLDECSDEELQRVSSLMGLVLGRRPPRVVALLGIRGAGKSTVGKRLAEELRLPFVELVDRIEELAGISLGAVFSFHGEGYYRRLELQALSELLSSGEACVVALPGGLVAHADAYDLVRQSCFSIWLKATPEEYLGRVYAQGDTRPMEGRTDAMIELRRLVESREPLYRQATVEISTSGVAPEEIVKRLKLDLEGAFMTVCPFICEPVT